MQEPIEIMKEALAGVPPHMRHALAALQVNALHKAGFVLVPREPTREMWAAGGTAVVGYKQRYHDKVVEDMWSAMIAASPDA